MTDLQKKAQEIYLRMNSYSNCKEMNGIDREWIIKKIEQGLEEYHKSELLKLNKSDVISSVCEHPILCTIEMDGEKYNYCKKCHYTEKQTVL